MPSPFEGMDLRSLAFPAPAGFTLRYAMKANPSRLNTAARPVCWSPTSTSGRAPSGSPDCG